MKARVIAATGPAVCLNGRSIALLFPRPGWLISLG